MKKLWQKIKALVSKEFALLKKHEAKAAVAIAVVNAFKAALDSGAIDFITRLTPTQLDDRLLQKARFLTPIILKKMALAQLIITQANNSNQVATAVITELKKRFPDGRKGFYVEFAGELNVALSDGELSFSEGVRLAQLLYEETK